MEAIKTDWRRAPISDQDLALLEYADKLTRDPAQMRRDDVNRLRAEGFTDEQISDAAQVIAFFNYINRIADGLGVDLEPEMPPDPRA